MSEHNCRFCGHEIATNKAGKKFCSFICWKKEPYKTKRISARLEVLAKLVNSRYQL